MYFEFLINIINIVEVIFFCSVIILIDLSFHKKYSYFVMGIVFGLITIMVMQGNVRIGDGHLFDFRHITMTMAGFIGGPVTAGLAAILSSIYRYNLGGNGMAAGIADIVVFGCLGSILKKVLVNRENKNRLQDWFIIGLIMSAVFWVIIVLSHLDESDLKMILESVYVPLIITPLATTIIFNFYYWAYVFFSKASILNTIMNLSPVNLMIYDSNGPILISENLKKQPQLSGIIAGAFSIPKEDKAWLNANLQEHREISAEDRKYFIADISGFQMPNGESACVAIVTDATERKREQEEIKRLKERFAKAFDLGPHMMAIIRKSDFRYIDVNRRYLEARGFAREDIIGKTPVEIGIPESEFNKVIEILEAQGGVENIEYKMQIKREYTSTVLLSAQTIQIEDQECILFAYNDVTEMKLMQADKIEQLKQRLKLEKELAKLDRLNLVGQMAAGIGHEIRNPMTTVRGYLQLLGAKPQNEEQKPIFELMISELDRANSIISEFLSLARTKQTALQFQNLNDIINHLYPLLEADTFTQNKQIKYIPEPIPDLELNKKEISQLVLNLARNGLEAMVEGGCLTIRTSWREDKVMLEIEDEGCGIPPCELDKLGTPFYTTKENGTGLGLATSFKIAEAHKARIDIVSSTRGTKFLISFPVPDKVNVPDKMII